MAFEQARAEGLCLRYPENLGIHSSITYENAVTMLTKALAVSPQVPYTWGWIDRPSEGQVYLVFIPPQSGFPNDGIRYQEVDNRYSIPAGSSTRELEIIESKYGFIPSSPATGYSSPDSTAWRVRRRFRLTKGGHPQLVLVHYGRGVAAPIISSLATQPVRPYPLRQVNEPALYVMGDKMGQKVYPGGHPLGAGGGMGGGGGGMGGGMGGMGSGMGSGMGGMGMGMNTGPGGMNPGAMGGVGPASGLGMQNMLAQQNREMEALERRAGRGVGVVPPIGGGVPPVVGGSGGGMGGGAGVGVGGARPHGSIGGGMGAMGAGAMGQQQQQRQVGPRVDDDDSADESEQISTRSLALTRYKRNHELMNEVFMFAAFGGPAARAAAGMKKQKKRKQKKEGDMEEEGEGEWEEKLATPFSIFDKNEMEAKMKILNVEIAELEASAAERREAALRREAAARLEAEEALNVADTGADTSVGLEAADILMEGITV
ncbi:hypothetical protein PILCRDRAFT_828437 [Piloderma croceum F 1598]|uniref:SWI/SNF and RSC complexes subunit Ssr4 N-terminal domain-containing protein n=1 Tax=Piloderma croceum (strain F 1598) TaxID=765440 RepID=A0A0C3AJY8_PILCF|nr:hypothetical protein PILCRDRAFT_828437 [Piloderma croceum F 1598]